MFIPCIITSCIWPWVIANRCADQSAAWGFLNMRLINCMSGFMFSFCFCRRKESLWWENPLSWPPGSIGVPRWWVCMCTVRQSYCWAVSQSCLLTNLQLKEGVFTPTTMVLCRLCFTIIPCVKCLSENACSVLLLQSWNDHNSVFLNIFNYENDLLWKMGFHIVTI